jgi:transcriptional regulator with XRE-family HTH domain
VPAATHDETIVGPQSWGQAIRRERIRRGLTLQEMADRIGMGQANYSRIENSRFIPKSSFIYMLVTEHNFPLEMFFPADVIRAAARRLG